MIKTISGFQLDDASNWLQ